MESVPTLPIAHNSSHYVSHLCLLQHVYVNPLLQVMYSNSNALLLSSITVLKNTFHYYFLSHVVAPNITAISVNQGVTSPAPVSFNCTVDSYPPSIITWLHNGAEVHEAPPRVTISTVQVDNRTQESTLTLLNTTAEDTGTYTCSAVNTVGMTNMTTELLVLGE